MNRIVLITGAARNIGKGIAKTLLAEGYTCILGDKDKNELHKTFTELTSFGKCYEYVLDLSDFEQIEKMQKWLQKAGLVVNNLVNNAAFESQQNILDFKPEEITKSNATNLAGPFYLSSLFAKNLVKKGLKGNLIFITSTHSQVIRTHPLYSSAKAAIEMFVKESALELAPHGIRVNAVAPGAVQESAKLLPDERVPLGVQQQPQDIGEGVAFLLSEKARFITGQTLVIDGGFSIAHTHYWQKRGKFSIYADH